MVGDADQSIYAFRGATIRNIVEFERDYPDARTILLEQNYRSTQTILSTANAVISRNPDRRDKRLWSEAGRRREDRRLRRRQRARRGGVRRRGDRPAGRRREARNCDVAVFYRTNAQSRVFEDIFLRVGLPYRVVGGVRFYERREVRDALAYLRVLNNPDDTVSLRRILNVPKRGIGDRAEELVAAVRRTGADLLRRRAAPARPSMAPPTTRCRCGVPGLATRRSAASPVSSSCWTTSASSSSVGVEVHDILDALLSRTGYVAELEASDDPQDASRVENLAELVTVAREFAGDVAAARASTDGEADTDGAAPLGSLAAFLERVALVADADSIPDSGDGVVTLMTLHTAKGLEFPVVFCTGWEDGVFPHQRTLGDPTELAEERRLAYVGITRARERLYLSRAIIRSAHGTPAANPPSRFLEDVPPSLVDWRRRSPPGPPRSAGSASAAATRSRRLARLRSPRSVGRGPGELEGGAAGDAVDQPGGRRPGQPRQVRAGHRGGRGGQRTAGQRDDRLRQLRAPSG